MHNETPIMHNEMLIMHNVTSHVAICELAAGFPHVAGFPCMVAGCAATIFPHATAARLRPALAINALH